MELFVVCLLAWSLDQWLGEPRRGHPLVAFGNAATWLETRLNRQSDAAPVHSRWRGILALFIMVVPLVSLVYLATLWQEWTLLIEMMLLYLAIAGRALVEHGSAVAEVLHKNDLPLARQRVGWMVSRETSAMDELAVNRATIESLLENGSDAIFGALFWFVIAGAPGVVLYRLVNTLDAMWGYRNARFQYFGWAVARFDDLLNWVPARLTALSYALLGNFRAAIRCWRSQAAQCESPNAGPVMAAGAGALGVQLGGAAIYHGERRERPLLGEGHLPQYQDIHRANRLIECTQWLWLVVIFVVGMANA